MRAVLRPTSKPFGYGAAFAAALFLYLIHASWTSHAYPSSIPGAALDDIYNSTLGFGTVFVVSLPSRTDRRDGITLAAALSGIQVEFIDGLEGQQVPDKAIPSNPGQGRMGEASIGSWRGHMNAISEIVRRNLSSAIILEDDVDWDIHLKQQLRDFAVGSRALTQPPFRTGGDQRLAEALKRGDEISFPSLLTATTTSFQPPTTSPYGDNWDILWLGHCGMTFPYAAAADNPSETNSQRQRRRGRRNGRVVRAGDDPTVPEKRHLTTWTQPDELKAQYPDHSRVYHHAQSGLCSLGYAVSRRGARTLLNEIGLKKAFDSAYDLKLGEICDENDENDDDENTTCLSVQPSLFNNYLPVGPRRAESDISDHGDGWSDVASTPNTRWSVRLNLGALVSGRGELLRDQMPDLGGGDGSSSSSTLGLGLGLGPGADGDDSEVR